ncbi:SH3 domain-containing protein [Streptomyces cinnamoneus]|uniref:SH3 domain-containing protein n=1 Tax=Streptomyces cinnamoneus TaxID=53446 RepID=UPI00340B0241
MKPDRKPTAGGWGGTTGEFVASHTVPAWGVRLWGLPDPEQRPVAELPAGTEVRVIERRPDGWVRVEASGGPSGWTDGRRLEEIPGAVPAGSTDSTDSTDSTGDAEELTAQLQAALSTCSRLLDDLNARRIDPDSFRVQAFRAGLVLRDEEAWMWDFASGWHRYDGIGLHHMPLPTEGRTVAGGDWKAPPGGPGSAPDVRGTWPSRSARGGRRS